MHAETLRGPRLRLLNTYRALATPESFVAETVSHYGDPFVAPFVNGNLVMTTEPELAKEMFRAKTDNFDPFAPDALVPLVGPGSIFAMGGERHRRERKLLMPPFHGERMRRYADIVVDATERRCREHRPHEPLLATTQRVSLDVILRAVFGLNDGSRERQQAYERAVTELVDAVSPSFLFMPFLQRTFGGLGPYARFIKLFEKTDRMLQEQIDTLRGSDPERRDDILSLMLCAKYEDGTPMSDEDIRSELRTLLVAGHETTAIALAWAVDAIKRHPSVEKKLREEIAAANEKAGGQAEAAQLAQLPYLAAVCNETLRRYPIVTEIMRTLREPMQWGGRTIDTGMTLAVSIVGIHMRPDIYPDPQRFRPERFIERSYTPNEFLPFGGGNRRCIGAAFATYEMKLALATMFGNPKRDVVVHDQRPPKAVRRNITMAPDGGVPATFTSR